MSDLIKMNDIDFQPLELILRERAADPMVWTYTKNKNFQAIQETVKHVTEDHFSKLYEYIYLNSKPLTREISKITREHFLNISKKPTKDSKSPEKYYLAARAPRLRILAPEKNRHRLNQSYVEATSKESSAQPKQVNKSFARNSSIEMMSQMTPSDYRAGSVDLNSILQVGGGRSSSDVDGKLKLPKIMTANEDSLVDITQKASNRTREFQMVLPRQNMLPSKDMSGKEEKKAPSFVANVLANPLFKEKYKEKANRARAETLIHMNNPDFAKLIRLITGDEKTQMVQLTKISREQLRAHLLKKYPSELADRFIQVMDFPSTFDTKTYLESFKALLTDGLDMTYFLCFKLFDINDDGIVNHRDIFSLMTLIDKYPVLQVDFNKLLYKPHKKAVAKFAITAKNLLRNTAQMSAGTSNSERKNFLVNKNTLTLKVNLLKTLESMISKQSEQRIINLSQLRMVHQTELNVFLNYKRGKYKYTAWADMLGVIEINAPKRLPPDRSNSRVSVSLQAQNPGTDKEMNFLGSVKALDANISKEGVDAISEWGEVGLDMVKFVEMFKDDMPYLLYDIVFHCTLADVSCKRYLFSAEEVFDMYKTKPVSDSNGNTSGTNIALQTKNSRTSGIFELAEGKDCVETGYSHLTD